MIKLRTIFVENLIKLVEKDNKIILLNDDTGFNLFEDFEKKLVVLKVVDTLREKELVWDERKKVKPKIE